VTHKLFPANFYFATEQALVPLACRGDVRCVNAAL
jgi:hypothetical protein